MFKHPATIINAADITEIKARIAAKHPPTLKGVQKLEWETTRSYQPTPCACVRNLWKVDPNNPNTGLCLAEKDAPMAFRQALMYIVKNDEQYAKNAIDIIDRWISCCKDCIGDNKQLDASWSQTCFARAVELLKYTYPNFASTGLEQKYNNWYDAVMKNAVATPITWKFNNTDTATNWHASICECRMQIALLRNDRKAFDEMVAEWKRCVSIIIKKPWHLPNETLYRDCFHGSMSLGSLAQAAELAWLQGVDLYSYDNSIMRNAVEAQAAICLNRPPVNLPKPLVSPEWKPYGYTIAYNHYVNRKNMVMPNTKELLDKYPVDYSWLCWGATTVTHRRK